MHAHVAGRPGIRGRSLLPLRVAAICLTLAAFGTAACVHRAGSSSPEEEQANPPVGPIEMSVDNRSQFNVTIYAVRGTLRQRLGGVAGTSHAEVVVPDMFTNDHGGFTVNVYQLGGPQSYVSDVMAPQRGERLRLTVQIRLSTSTVVVE